MKQAGKPEQSKTSIPSAPTWNGLSEERNKQRLYQDLSRYISNLNELKIAKNNINIAKNIFNTVKFQYDKGIKAYLEVIVSETDLRSAELNYLNILFQGS